jgi:hypothetical protein
LPQASAIEIDKARPSALRDQSSRQRIVAKTFAAKVRRQASDVGQRVNLDAQEPQPRAVRKGDLEGNSGEPQETGLIGRREEAFDKCRFDLVEVQLACGLLWTTLRQVWCLPLRNRARGVRVIVAGPAMRFMVMMVVVMMIMCVIMILIAVRVVVMVMSMHGQSR